VYVVQSEGKLALARLIWQIIAGRAHEGEDLDVHHVMAATIETGASTMPVARDGEVAQLTMPLQFRIRPKALVVLAHERREDVT
jgi:diacylglycerol kinase family enzyme